MSDKVTATMICDALENQYSSPEWYIGFEVGNSTGSNCKRHADAVAINAYPSKGFETRGFEIKVAKSDLKSELDNGIKADEVARFCDFWFLVTPKGLTDDFTIPPTYGVIEYNNGKLTQKTRATKLDKQPPTSGFMCAVLRGRERTIQSLAIRLAKEKEERIKRDTEYSAKTAISQLKELHIKLAEIKEATGIDLSDWTPTISIIRKLNAAESLDVICSSIQRIEYATKNLIRDTNEVQKAVDMMKAGG